MDVSVIIINYNTFNYTCDCIRSVIKNTAGIVYEIILVDNASTECDPVLFYQKFPSVHLVRSEKNLGFAGGNNLGLEKASGQNILLLNSDTIVTDNAIGNMFKKCAGIKNLGAATVKLTYPDGRIQPAAQSFYSLTAHILFTTRLYKLFKNLYKRKKGNFDFTKNFTADWIWGTFFYFPVSNLQYMGGRLSETYFMYSEDVEWCYLFKKNGLENYYFGEFSIIHLGGKSSTKVFKNKTMIRHHLDFIKRTRGGAISFAEKMLLLFDEYEWKLRFGSKKSNQ